MVEVQEFGGSVQLSAFIDTAKRHFSTPVMNGVAIYDAETFEQVCNRKWDLRSSGAISIKALRRFVVNSEACALDPTGVVPITDRLAKMCCLGTTVVIAGAGDHVRIWNPTALLKVVEIRDHSDGMLYC